MELIFVNDASQDSTLSILQKFELKFPDDIIVINLENNCGPGIARNIALEYCSAEYIGFVDSDDVVDKDMFLTLFDAIKENDCDIVECDWDHFSDDSMGYTPSAFEIDEKNLCDFCDDTIKTRYLIKQLFFTSVWNKIFKRTFIVDNKLQFAAGKKYEDMYFCYLAILHARKYYHVSKTLYHYYLNSEGTVQQRKSLHQFDMMDVAIDFLQETKARGLYTNYKDIIEWMFLEKYYVYMIWDVWDSFNDTAYMYYTEVKAVVQKLVPDYRENPYRKMEYNKMDNLLLKLLDYPLGEDDFNSFMRKIWEQQNGEKSK
jgi:glycosyltransferase involved in cell wall biosynthesis